MSKRDQIFDGSQVYTKSRGLVYTEIIGWVDVGHAQGGDIKSVLAQMDKSERESKTDTYLMRYEQSMGVSKWGIKIPVASIGTT